MQWVIGVAVVVAVLAALEVLVTTVGRERVESALGAALGTDVAVALRDRPLLLALARGRLAQVDLHARDVPVGDGPDVALLAVLDVALSGVRLPRAVRPDVADLVAEQGRFEARIDEAQVAVLADLPSVVSRIELVEGKLWVTAVGARFSADVAARDGALVISPRNRGLRLPLVGELVVDLPELPAGAVVEEVELRDGYALVRGPLDGDRLVAV